MQFFLTLKGNENLIYFFAIIKFAGCGASVPLTGFGYLLTKGVKEAVSKEGMIGILKGGLSSSLLEGALQFLWVFLLQFFSTLKRNENF